MRKDTAALFQRPEPEAHEMPVERSPEQLMADYQAHLAEAVLEHSEHPQMPFTLDPFVYTPADMWTEPRPHDIVPGLIFERSMGVIVSEPHVGKTLMLLDMAIAVSAGQRWINWHPAKAVPALVFALDSPGWESCEQARNLMAGRGIDPMTTYPLFAVAGRERAKAEMGRFNILDKTHLRRVQNLALGMGAKLIGFDSLSKLHRGEENDRGAMEEVMSVLENLANATGAHVMVMHHSPVAGRQSRTTNAGRGSGVIGASIDLEFHLSKRKNGSRVLDVLKGRGSDIADQRFALSLERVQHPTVPRAVRWTVEGAQGDTRPRGDKIDEALLDTMKLGPQTRKQLAEVLTSLGLAAEAKAYGTVNNRLVLLEEDGAVLSKQRGLWELTNAD